MKSFSGWFNREDKRKPSSIDYSEDNLYLLESLQEDVIPHKKHEDTTCLDVLSLYPNMLTQESIWVGDNAEVQAYYETIKSSIENLEIPEYIMSYSPEQPCSIPETVEEAVRDAIARLELLKVISEVPEESITAVWRGTDQHCRVILKRNLTNCTEAQISLIKAIIEPNSTPKLNYLELLDKRLKGLELGGKYVDESSTLLTQEEEIYWRDMQERQRTPTFAQNWNPRNIENYDEFLKLNRRNNFPIHMYSDEMYLRLQSRVRQAFMDRPHCHTLAMNDGYGVGEHLDNLHTLNPRILWAILEYLESVPTEEENTGISQTEQEDEVWRTAHNGRAIGTSWWSSRHTLQPPHTHRIFSRGVNPRTGEPLVLTADIDLDEWVHMSDDRRQSIAEHLDTRRHREEVRIREEIRRNEQHRQEQPQEERSSDEEDSRYREWATLLRERRELRLPILNKVLEISNLTVGDRPIVIPEHVYARLLERDLTQIGIAHGTQREVESVLRNCLGLFLIDLHRHTALRVRHLSPRLGEEHTGGFLESYTLDELVCLSTRLIGLFRVLYNLQEEDSETDYPIRTQIDSDGRTTRVPNPSLGASWVY